MKETTKIIATIIGTTVLSVSGTYSFTDNQVELIETELEAKTAEVTQKQQEKILTGRDYILSQVTSKRTPVFTGAMTSDEVITAYIEAFYAYAGEEKTNILIERIKKGEEINLQNEIELLAQSKGEMLICTNPLPKEPIIDEQP